MFIEFNYVEVIYVIDELEVDYNMFWKKWKVYLLFEKKIGNFLED